MLKNNIIKYNLSFFFMGIIAWFFNFSGQSNSVFNQDSLFHITNDKIIILIIHKNIVFCPLCQDLLTDFCNQLYAEELENKTIGIFIPDNSDASSKEIDHFSILKKQLRGFEKSNNIRFPLVIDKERIFWEFYFDKADIIFIDIKRNILRKYKLPLSLDQWKELISN